MNEKACIIDDNEFENFIAKSVISKKKIAEKITTFSTVADSLSYLQSIENDVQEFPDLIFLDINMPVLNGFDFLEKFSVLPENLRNHCEVIMLTSSDEQKDIDKALSFSVVKNYLVKPLKAGDLDCL